ncbi:MAG: folate-binding protein YgfZ [Chloroflexi bacterium]|nr:folate-binding protein YgfZ [Chloroflexota bacterium]
MLAAHHARWGAFVADDGIPQHYGSPYAEFEAAHRSSVVLDRSHEARLRVDGTDRLALIHRTSTNDVERLAAGSGRPTIFTNANGRVLERAEVYAAADHAVLIGGPGRASALHHVIRSNVFFRDDIKVHDMASATAMFAVHGPRSADVLSGVGIDVSGLALFGHTSAQIAGGPAWIARAKPLTGDHLRVIVPAANALAAWDAIVSAAAEIRGLPAGSETYHILRVEAGVPAAGSELTDGFIPLELGLWDEVSFSKGCYTGQEIIARMESRGKLAKTIVTLALDAPVTAPADLLIGGKRAGTLTSLAITPDGQALGIGVLKPEFARAGVQVATPDGSTGTVSGTPGVQPPV